jgi:hypothetical protein
MSGLVQADDILTLNQVYAAIFEPLRRLTRQNTEWNWGTEQEAAFEKLKQELSSKTVMTYFIPKLDINIYVDASPVGLGGNTPKNTTLSLLNSHFSKFRVRLFSGSLLNVLSSALSCPICDNITYYFLENL